MNCLQKEPQRRYASANELAEELQRFLNDRPIQARPVTQLERGYRRWAFRCCQRRAAAWQAELK